MSASPAAGASASVGEYELSLEFDPAISPFDRADIDGAPHAIASADFNVIADDGIRTNFDIVRQYG